MTSGIALLSLSREFQLPALFLGPVLASLVFLLYSKPRSIRKRIVWFKAGNKTKSKTDLGTTRALPASWYRSEPMYELERRSIFSKKWLVVTHKTRFMNDGDFVQVTEAGFTFFLIKDRKGVIQGFHNMCRHRAYPLVEQPCGNKKVLACKYHGWSYGFDGKLAKAPYYQELPNFDKASNGLYKIHVHVDRLGFVWVNLNADENPTAWADDFRDIDVQPRLQQFDMAQYHFDHEWSLVGDYNWKTLADNYNECYHCPTGHPGVAAISDSSKYWVETDGGSIQHFNVDKDGIDESKAPKIYSTFYYPNASITISPVFFYIQRVIPISASQTKMEYEVYRHNTASNEDFEYINKLYKQVLQEDKDLCNGAQKNLNAGVFVNGELHPRVEKGPLFFQAKTRELVMGHREEEERCGKAIWPGTPKHPLSKGSQDEISFCDGLDCETMKEELAW